MKQLPFDSSQLYGSNVVIFRFLRPLDAEIFGETSKWRSTGSVKCRFVDISSIISAFRHRRSMKQLPFDSSQCDGSNGGIFRFLRPLDAEIFGKKLSGAVPKCVKMLISIYLPTYFLKIGPKFLI